ncbi:hypothetical protein [Streptomyces sp. DH12]|uniref:hypothetical protein n=1 Tax=Streptomyces sp. DH12 TaxID=2857010 RepID=UPI001E45DFF8|nr:hypothetical protein [Streptomyces sp. DH12]
MPCAAGTSLSSAVTWGRDLPLRYVLEHEEWDGEQVTWAWCVDVDGLFVDREPVRERLVLEGCEAEGRLRLAAERCAGGPVPLGELPVLVEDGADDSVGDWWTLDQVAVVGAADGDVVVEAVVTEEPRSPARPVKPEVLVFNGVSGDVIGRARRVAGLDRVRRRPQTPPLRLLGCEPWEPLLRRMRRERHGGDGGLLLRALDRSGRTLHVEEAVSVEVAECRPSSLGGALVDVTLRYGAPDPRPAAARAARDAWFEGPPRERNAWAGLSSEGRREWLRYTEPRPGPDGAGAVCELDGRFVTDVPGLECALGEAVAGPGGGYVQCWAALRGCQCGGEAPPEPFTLVWRDADVARGALAGVSVDSAGELTYVGSVVRLLRRVGVTVELR